MGKIISECFIDAVKGKVLGGTLPLPQPATSNQMFLSPVCPTPPIKFEALFDL